MGKIAILGLGDSLTEYDPSCFDYAIGVNDIWRYHQPNAIVCLNHPNSFTPERLKIINNSTPDIFYSQIVEWDVRKDFKKIELLPGYPDNFCQLETSALHKSYCSPFVACQVAYKYHFADEIHLFGVDLVNHPHLDSTICSRIKTHFHNLHNVLHIKGCRMIIHGSGILVAI